MFENAFNDYHLELAWVEVSSNGVDFVRFDNVSNTPGPVNGYGSVEASLVNGLAGKYRQGFGAPFDLSALAGKTEAQSGLVDLSRISHIRIVDITGDGSCFDSLGHAIYDPFPTAGSSGFDLDAIGVSGGAPYPDSSLNEQPDPDKPADSEKAGFGKNGGCFISGMRD